MPAGADGEQTGRRAAYVYDDEEESGQRIEGEVRAEPRQSERQDPRGRRRHPKQGGERVRREDAREPKTGGVDRCAREARCAKRNCERPEREQR